MRKKTLSIIIAAILLGALVGTSLAASSNSEKVRGEGASGKLNKKRAIVVYNRDTDNKDADELEEKGAKIRHIYKIIPGIAVEVNEENIDNIKSNRNVKDVIWDTPVHAFLQQSVPQINANQVHSLGETASGVRVCIVDSGVDDTHPALNPLVAEYDFVNLDNDATDDDGHGTHVAGIVASVDATYGGVAPGADLMAAKVLDADGSGWTSDVVAGIDWCVTNNADVINLSLGGGRYGSDCDNRDLSAQAGNNAVDAGVVVLAATGNDGWTRFISAPACGSKVIAVGGVGDNDERTPYSNEGAELDIVAPGGTSADGIISAKLGGGFVGKYGTSMATPHASGAAALILGKNPSLTPEQVKSIMINTAVDLGDQGFDTIYGYGRIDTLAAHQAAPSPKVVFVSDRYGNNDIFSVNADGASLIRLTSAPADDFLPNVYTDKSALFESKITFVSKRDGNPEIYIMNIDGAGQTRLTSNGALDFRPILSSDGSKIVFDSNRDGDFEIYIMNSDGSGQTRLTTSAGDDYGARFSPDGSKIVFTSLRDGGKSEIYLMNADGTNQIRLTDNTFHDLRPVFSSDGTKIAFDSNRAGNYNIYLMNNDGTGQQQLTSSSVDARQPMFFNKENKLVYYTFSSMQDKGNSEIYSVDYNGNTVQITNNSAIDYYPATAFDDSKLFFISDRDGNYEVYSSNPDGSSQTNLTNNASGDWWVGIGS